MNITVPKSIRKFVQEIKSVFESNKVTMLIIVSYTVWEAVRTAIPFEYYWDILFFIELVPRVLHCLILPSLFLETCFAQSKGKCICGYIVAVIVSGVMAVWQMIGPDGSLFKEYAERLWGGVLLILLVAIVYKSYKKTKLSFVKYIIRLFGNVAKSFVIWCILLWCGAYVDWIVESCLLRGYYYEYNEWMRGRILVMDTLWMGPVEILIMGCYLGPKMILALRDMGEKV